MNKTRYVAHAGMIAAVYAAVTILTSQILQWLSWSIVQFRVSEALTVAAFFTPAAIPGLALGSVIANGYNFAVTGNPVLLLDVVLGSLGTLLGALWTWRFRATTALGLLGPVITNALIVPAYLPIVLRSFGMTEVPVFGLQVAGPWLPMYLVGVVTVAVGQAAVLYTLGWGLLAALRRLGLEEMLAT